MENSAANVQQPPSSTKEDQQLEERKQRVKLFLRRIFQYDLLFVLIFVGASILQFSYFAKTLNQPLWWDEAEYMATGKHWALGVPFDVGPRPPLFQFLAALLIKLNFPEYLLKFFLVTLPSLLVIFAVYLLGKELFGKKVGALSAAASMLVWSYLFWSQRFQPDFFSIFFQLLAFLFFWKLFKTDQRKDAISGGASAALALYFKISALLVPLSLFLFVLFKDGIQCVKKKNYWIAAGAYILVLIPFFLYNHFYFDDTLAFTRAYTRQEELAARPPGWMTLSFIHLFPKWLFFIFFLIGVGATLLYLLISFDFLLKDKQKRMHPGVFALIILFTTSLFYIFYIRGTIEDRWLFLMIPFIMYFAVIGLTFLSERLNFNKYLPQALIIIAFLFLAYTQLQHATQLIETKKTSYAQVKESGLWIKQNSNPGDIIVSMSYPQTTFYAERQVFGILPNQTDFDEFIDQKKPSHLIVSIFEPHPPWINEWLQQNQQRLTPVQAYFADQEQKQPLLIVYAVR